MKDFKDMNSEEQDNIIKQLNEFPEIASKFIIDAVNWPMNQLIDAFNMSEQEWYKEVGSTN